MPPPSGSLLQLLEPARRSVPLHGRQRELEQMAQWARNPAPRGAMLLHGASGQGQTRLALEFAERCCDEDWTVVQARHVVLGDPPPQPSRVPANDRVLVLIDDAHRLPLMDVVGTCAGRWLDSDTVLRVLMTSHRAGRWWHAAEGELFDLGVIAAEVSLDPPPDRPGVFEHARAAYAALLDAGDPAQIEAPVDVDGEPFGTTLAIHLAAAVAVDASRRQDSTPEDLPGLLRYLFARERALWIQLASRRLINQPSEQLARATLVAALAGPARPQLAILILQQTGLAKTPEQAQTLLADYDACVGHGAAGETLKPISPRTLRTHLVGEALQNHAGAGTWSLPEALDALFPVTVGSVPTYGARVLSSLVDAAVHDPSMLATHAGQLLKREPRLAKELGAVSLADIAAAVTIDVLYGIKTLLPSREGPDGSWAAMMVEERLIRHSLSYTKQPTASVDLLALLADRLARAGRIDEAIVNAERGLAISRHWAAVDANAHAVVLAASLANLAQLLFDADRRDAALELTEEAVQRLREHVHSGSSYNKVMLADMLTQLNRQRHGLGKLDDALAPLREAVDILEQHAASPADQEHRLLPALSTLSRQLTELGRWQEASTIVERVVRLRAALAAAAPETAEPGLATSLLSLANRLYEQGRGNDALTASHEAVDIYRRLAADDPGIHDDGLAAALSNLGVDFMVAGRVDEAIEAGAEAVAIRRRLAAVDFDRHASGLAAALSTHSQVLNGARRTDDAFRSAQEAVDLHRRLAEPVDGAARLGASLH